MPALSPRSPAHRLRSTSGDAPRRSESTLQRRAIIQGFTFRAGPKTLSRLRRGIVHPSYEQAVQHVSDTQEKTS